MTMIVIIHVHHMLNNQMVNFIPGEVTAYGKMPILVVVLTGLYRRHVLKSIGIFINRIAEICVPTYTILLKSLYMFSMSLSLFDN